MGLFCFGSYTRILLSCCPKVVTNKSFCGALLLAFKTESIIYDVRGDDDTVSKLLGGGQNIPSDVIEVAQKINYAKVVKYFEKEIIPKIDDSKKKHLVLGLKELIADDQMDEDTQLGTSISFKKSEVVSMNVISFTEFLVNLFLYAVRVTDNTTHKKEMKKIGRKYCDKFEAVKDSISLYELPEVLPVMSLSKTVLGKKFDTVFERVSKDKLKIKNPSDIQIHRLAIENQEFCYDKLHDFLLNNVGNYVHSRMQVQTIIDDEEYGTIAIKALQLMNQNGRPDEKGTGNELGELLLYIFMEQVLQAPKLMSKVELAGLSASNTSKSDGIHLLTSGGVTPFNQLVFGASLIDDGLRGAVDSAFNHVQEIKSSKSSEYRLVESSVFYQVFDDETKAVAKNIIVPQKLNIDRPSMAFGMFLGYKLDAPIGNFDDDEYKAEVIAKMEKDIGECSDYIYNRIVTLGLSGHSFYIYVVPFNDAILDKKAIMEKLMTMGGAD